MLKNYTIGGAVLLNFVYQINTNKQVTSITLWRWQLSFITYGVSVPTPSNNILVIFSIQNVFLLFHAVVNYSQRSWELWIFLVLHCFLLLQLCHKGRYCYQPLDGRDPRCTGACTGFQVLVQDSRYLLQSKVLKCLW